MKKFEVRIPRAVRMTEWEILVVEADNEVDALDHALHHTNVINATFDTDDYETIDRYDDEIEVKEIENAS